jgi:hypothetical protein
MSRQPALRMDPGVRIAKRRAELAVVDDILTAIASFSTTLLLVLIVDQLFFGATISYSLF